MWVWSRHLDAHQRDGGYLPYGLIALTLALAGAASVISWTAAATAAVLDIDPTARLVRPAGAPSLDRRRGAVCGPIASRAPWFLAGTSPAHRCLDALMILALAVAGALARQSRTCSAAAEPRRPSGRGQDGQIVPRRSLRSRQPTARGGGARRARGGDAGRRRGRGGADGGEPQPKKPGRPPQKARGRKGRREEGEGETPPKNGSGAGGGGGGGKRGPKAAAPPPRPPRAPRRPPAARATRPPPPPGAPGRAEVAGPSARFLRCPGRSSTAG